MKFNKYHCLENDFIIVEEINIDIKYLCDQHKAIGADGLIYIYDNKIYFFNKDGSKAKMCGNGIRCAAKYLNDNNKKKDSFIFEDKEFIVTNENNFYTLHYDFLKYKKKNKYYLVYGDVNHVVLFEEYNQKKAEKLFKKYNCNITFCLNNFAKTYEKGVGLTRGCGTGLIAIMNILYLENNVKKIDIKSLGGLSTLEVCDNKILLKSEVKHIYKGEIL